MKYEQYYFMLHDFRNFGKQQYPSARPPTLRFSDSRTFLDCPSPNLLSDVPEREAAGFFSFLLPRLKNLSANAEDVSSIPELG